MLILLIEADSLLHKGQYDKLALENKGMFRIGSVDCNDFETLCNKEGITSFPSYKIYPELPIPPVDYVQEPGTELDTDKLKKQAYRFIGNRVIDITSANHDTFKDDNPGKPKMLLFTDKKSTPITYRALSTYFDVSEHSQLTGTENPGVRHCARR